MYSQFIQMANYIHMNTKPHCRMIALELCKQKIQPTLMDVKRGVVSKEEVLGILETGFRVGILKHPFYQESCQKLKNL